MGKRKMTYSDIATIFCLEEGLLGGEIRGKNAR